MTAPPAVPSFVAGASLLAACPLATPLFAAGESALPLLAADAAVPLVLAVPPLLALAVPPLLALAVPPLLVLAVPAMPVPEPAVAAAVGT
jgi:hypothetical protein